MEQENNMNNMNNNYNNNMENWAVSAMSPISYQLNISWLNVIIVKEYLSGFISL